ncbi:hypothetical protein NDU88_003365 [Pleurodeles waltl]|uniref:Uncharacterized protein n=1 Tax=Pleurodeles waltl TaxID=8319 RepID=A0AAV7SDF8_PLEWA|nr:hypothetical protein NDU88_003365 [Pleurodeles waltl]
MKLYAQGVWGSWSPVGVKKKLPEPLGDAAGRGGKLRGGEAVWCWRLGLKVNAVRPGKPAAALPADSGVAGDRCYTFFSAPPPRPKRHGRESDWGRAGKNGPG